MTRPIRAARGKTAFSRRLASLRLEAGLSLRALGQRCGISSVHLWQMESGSKGGDNPSVRVLLALCRALKTDPNTLLDFGGE